MDWVKKTPIAISQNQVSDPYDLNIKFGRDTDRTAADEILIFPQNRLHSIFAKCVCVCVCVVCVCVICVCVCVCCVCVCVCVCVDLLVWSANVRACVQ